uniref:Uncharacterized protein n=1 Tax=Panagrolaimus davidi TaxID=227884 RepID=A0A914QIQ5_9BILA
MTIERYEAQLKKLRAKDASSELEKAFYQDEMGIAETVRTELCVLHRNLQVEGRPQLVDSSRVNEVCLVTPFQF